jgi:OOP family OmpA-OmpF porin
MTRYLLAAAAICLAGAAVAQELALPPGAVVVAEAVDPATDVPFPTAAWGRFDPVTARAEGTVTRRVWRIPSESLTTLQLLQPLRRQLEAKGYAILFECADTTCGGFDFRFALDLIGEPDMHVDLGDFRYLAASQDGTRVALVVSRSEAAGFVHLTAVGAANAPVPVVQAPVAPVAPVAPPSPVVVPMPDAGPAGGLAATLAATGHAVLEGLDFGTGASQLGPGPFPALEELADWLQANPGATVVLVGHTDASGALDANISLSRARAQSVRSRLIDAYGIAPARLSADGVGYLSPRAPNDTEAGRQANRRVEVVLRARE